MEIERTRRTMSLPALVLMAACLLSACQVEVNQAPSQQELEWECVHNQNPTACAEAGI